jgi:hypothetical protein
MNTSELSGSWTYRSFNPTFVRGNETPQEDALILADDVVLTLRPTPDPAGLAGEIEWQGGGLDLNGTVVVGGSVSFDLVGIGRRETDGWEYRYQGSTTPWRPNVTDQRPTLVGSVFRAKPHNGVPIRSPAGYVASFIAMKQQPPPGSETYRDLMGSWTYRSFHNNATYPYLPAPPTASGLILQEAVFKLETPSSTTLEGTIELPGGGVLDIGRGFVPVGEEGEPPKFAFVGTGRSGTQTDGWEYSYDGHLTRHWPNAVDQRPALVGSVIRVKSHDGWQWLGGVALPFIAVKQPPSR